VERKRALIVDDDDPIRVMLAKIVERQNVAVDTARDGVEALEFLDRHSYDVVLLDLMMPRLDGYGVLRHLEEHNPAMLACTIIASAVPESEVLRRFVVPVFKIHAKPFDMSKLIADIRECTQA
jgi:DNA-binding response OmpR family regulator